MTFCDTQCLRGFGLIQTQNRIIFIMNIIYLTAYIIYDYLEKVHSFFKI